MSFSTSWTSSRPDLPTPRPRSPALAIRRQRGACIAQLGLLSSREPAGLSTPALRHARRRRVFAEVQVFALEVDVAVADKAGLGHVVALAVCRRSALRSTPQALDAAYLWPDIRSSFASNSRNLVGLLFLT